MNSNDVSLSLLFNQKKNKPTTTTITMSIQIVFNELLLLFGVLFFSLL